MNPAGSTPRLSAYFAFGVQWGGSAQPPRAGEAGDATARTGRVIDVKAKQINTESEPRKTLVQPPPRAAANVFLPVTTYAPQPGQGLRLVQSGANLGQNLDTWA